MGDLVDHESTWALPAEKTWYRGPWSPLTGSALRFTRGYEADSVCHHCQHEWKAEVGSGRSDGVSGD
jgi:hypothetical protein